MPNASLTYCIERQSCERDAKLQKTKNMVRRTILCLCRSESCFHTPSCPLKLSPFAVLVAKDLVVGTCAASLTWAKPMPSRLSKSLTKEKKMCQGTGGGSKLCMWRRKNCGSALQKRGLQFMYPYAGKMKCQTACRSSPQGLQSEAAGQRLAVSRHGIDMHELVFSFMCASFLALLQAEYHWSISSTTQKV